MIYLVGLLLIAGIVGLVLRQKRKSAPTDRPRVAQKKTVAIHPGANACAAAQELAGKPFSPAEAPKLPLPDCDVRECRCSYDADTDRRKGNRRRADDGLTDPFFSDKERRDHDRRH